MKPTLIPILVLAVASVPTVIGLNARKRGAINKRELTLFFGYSFGMLVWCLAASVVAYNGLLLSDQFLRLLPGFWLPAVPFLAVVMPLALPNVRRTFAKATAATPLHWFANIQAIRIAAIGTAIQAHRGHFPMVPEYLVGYPDLLFGISAIWVARKAKAKELSMKFWILWNAFGFGLILPFGLLITNLYLPGPLELSNEYPTYLVAYHFPLSLVPTAILPWIIAGNAWGIAALDETDSLGIGSGKVPNHVQEPNRFSEIHPNG